MFSFNLFSITSFLLLVFFLYKLLKISGLRSSKLNLPPSPPRLPVIGNLHQLGTPICKYFHSLSQKYGDLMLVYTGFTPTVVVSSAEVAAEVMKTHDITFSDRPVTRTFKAVFYGCKNLILSPYGEYWRQMRSLSVLHLLSVKRVRSFRRVREEELALMVEKIRKSPSTTINLSEYLVALTNNVTCRVAFGRKYERDENGGIDFGKLTEDLLRLFVAFNIGDHVPWLAWINSINGVDKETNRIVKIFDDFLEKVIQDHLDSATDEGKHGDGEEKMKDLVHIILEIQKEYPALDGDSIKGFIMDMFLAGTDTSFITMEWAMSEILRQPEVMRKLQQEVRGIVGNKEVVSEDDLDNMTYLKAVIKETLRLHPPLPLLVTRVSTQDVKINGYDIPAGTTLMVNAWTIGRSPTYWKEPEKFLPERFLNSSIDFKGHDFQLIPFGAGRRGCPGTAFAVAIVELVLANLMHRFDWALPVPIDDEFLAEFPTDVSHKKKSPLLVVATPKM